MLWGNSTVVILYSEVSQSFHQIECIQFQDFSVLVYVCVCVFFLFVYKKKFCA